MSIGLLSFGVLLSFSMTAAIFSFAEFPVSSSYVLLIAAIVTGAIALLVSNNPIYSWMLFLPLLYIPAKPILFYIWGIVFFVLFAFIPNTRATHQRVPLVLSSALSLIVVFSIIGYIRSNHELLATINFLGSYILPIVVYYTIIKLPIDSTIETRLPRAIYIVFAIIGIGSLIYKIQHPSQERISGYIEMSPTMLGYVGASLIPIGLFFLDRSKRKYSETILFAFLGIAILLTNTRMAFLMVIAAMLVNYNKLKRFAMPLLAISIIVIIIGLDIFFQRLTNINRTSFDPSIVSRLIAWDTGLRLISEHPLLGIGLSSFSDLYLGATKVPLIRLVHAHNSFLQKAADIGIPGMLVFFSFIGWRLKAAFKYGGTGLPRAMTWGLSIYLLATMSDAIFYRTEWSLFFWILLGCLDRFTLYNTNNDKQFYHIVTT